MKILSLNNIIYIIILNNKMDYRMPSYELILKTFDFWFCRSQKQQYFSLTEAFRVRFVGYCMT